VVSTGRKRAFQVEEMRATPYTSPTDEESDTPSGDSR